MHRPWLPASIMKSIARRCPSRSRAPRGVEDRGGDREDAAIGVGGRGHGQSFCRDRASPRTIRNRGRDVPESEHATDLRRTVRTRSSRLLACPTSARAPPPRACCCATRRPRTSIRTWPPNPGRARRFPSRLRDRPPRRGQPVRQGGAVQRDRQRRLRRSSRVRAVPKSSGRQAGRVARIRPAARTSQGRTVADPRAGPHAGTRATPASSARPACTRPAASRRPAWRRPRAGSRGPSRSTGPAASTR